MTMRDERIASTTQAARVEAGWPSPFVRCAPAIAVAAGVASLLVAVSSELLNDPDTQWHVATGGWIWSHRSLPASDVFSHTFAGAPWIAKEWVSQLILFAAHRLAGWRGVALATAVAMATTYGILYAWLAQRLRASVALTATLLAVVLAAPHILARPHAFVFPVIVLWITGLVAALERRAVPPWRLAVLMLAWANMHGSFPLGLALAGCLAGEGVLTRHGRARIVALRDWGLFLAVSCGAALVSPYGWDAVLVPLRMGGNAAMPFLTEWQPLSVDATGILALGLLTASLLALAGNARANVFRLLALGLVAALMIRHSRFIDLFGIVAPVLAAGSSRLMPTTEAPAVRAPLIAAGVLSLAAAGLVATTEPLPNPRMTPDAAVRAALAAGVSGPIYNDYDFGGFLIARRIKTFVDGRSDQLFTGDFLPGLQRALNAKGHADFAALLARYRVRWALVRPKSQEAAHLAALPGWSKLFEDGVAAVYSAAPSGTANVRPAATSCGRSISRKASTLETGLTAAC